MSVSGPPIQSSILWAKQEARFLAVLERGLVLLHDKLELPQGEVDLNRELYFSLLSASREANEDISPLCECNNQPDPDDEKRATREGKRPDFQWVYLDRFEPDPNRSSKQFVVECKRLGFSTRTDWVLNRNYVDHGIVRFINSQWGYARRLASGAMVGYWQSMEGDVILRDVNDAAKKHGISPIVLTLDVQEGDFFVKLEHILERPFDISPFTLLHRWVDLRGKCSLSTKKKLRRKRAPRKNLPSS